jgi:rare lipoprotein A
MQGPASWYGPGFEGLTTACGGAFDSGALTLASRELGCGTRVRVSAPGGQSVEATVTDWGPAEWTSRRFDLSAATFAAIAHPGAGVIRVTVETL